MNNICYNVSIRKDNYCDKFMRIFCCCKNNKIYYSGDKYYNNIGRFIVKYATFKTKTEKSSLVPKLDYIHDAHMIFTNTQTLSSESIKILQICLSFHEFH